MALKNKSYIVLIHKFKQWSHLKAREIATSKMIKSQAQAGGSRQRISGGSKMRGQLEGTCDSKMELKENMGSAILQNIIF